MIILSLIWAVAFVLGLIAILCHGNHDDDGEDYSTRELY